MVEQVARALAAVGRRERFVTDEDLVFPGDAGGHLDASALRVRYKAALARAGLRPLRFHDLRHTFGTLAVRRAELMAVQSWMAMRTFRRRCASSATVIAAARRGCWWRRSR